MLLIFDLDGTIADTLTDLYEATRHVCIELGKAPVTKAQVRSFVGNGVNMLLARALKCPVQDEAVRRGRALFDAYYDAHCTQNTNAYPGIGELLQRLKGEGHTLIVLTNKPRPQAVKIVEKLYPGLFSQVLGQEEGLLLKPDPSRVFQIMEQTGDSPGNTCLIGDSCVDIALAQNADVRCVCLDWGFGNREDLVQKRPQAVVSTARALYTEIKNICE